MLIKVDSNLYFDGHDICYLRFLPELAQCEFKLRTIDTVFSATMEIGQKIEQYLKKYLPADEPETEKKAD